MFDGFKRKTISLILFFSSIAYGQTQDRSILPLLMKVEESKYLKTYQCDVYIDHVDFHFMVNGVLIRQDNLKQFKMPSPSQKRFIELVQDAFLGEVEMRKSQDKIQQKITSYYLVGHSKFIVLRKKNSHEILQNNLSTSTASLVEIVDRICP